MEPFMKACNRHPGGRCIVGPIDVTRERYGGHVDVGTGWGTAEWFVDNRVGQLQVRVQGDDCMYILKTPI